MLGALLALLGACFHGTNNASLRRGVLTGSVSQALAITITLGVPFSLLAAWLSGQLFQLGDLGARGALFAGSAGILQYVWGRYWNYSATKFLGGVGAGPIQQSQMWIAVVLAVVLLDERLTLLTLMGMGLIFVAPFIIARSLRLRRLHNQQFRAQQAAAGKSVEVLFEPRIMVGYGCAVLAALGYGVAPVVVRAGVGESGLGLLGGMIAYCAAFVTFWTISLIVPGQLRHIREVEPEPRKWYLFAGVMTYLGQACYFMSLSLAPVTVVAPLFQLSLIVRVIAGYLLNREHEVFTRLSLIAILIAFCGTMLITLDLILGNG